MGYTTKNYVEPGGAKTVIGGTLDIQGQMTKNGAFFMPARMRIPVDYRLDWYFRGLVDGSNIYTNGSTMYTSGTVVTIHTAMCDIYDPQLLFGNCYNNAVWNNWDMIGTNDLSVAFSIVYNGAVYQAYFNGQTTCVIKPGGFVVCDPIGIQIPKGATYYMKTFFDAGAGGKYPYGIVTNGTTEGFTNGSNTTASAAVTSTITTACNVYAPFAMIATTSSNVGSVLVVGDSVARGTNDSSVGYINRALQDTGIGYINIARPSEKATGFLNNNRMYRIQSAKYCNAAVVEYAINDITDAAITTDTIKQNLVRIWTDLAARGMRVYQCTITPVSSSTDGWKTIEGQTTSPYNSKRIEINNFIRTYTQYPLSGYFEIADLVETRDSGIWKPSPDGGAHVFTSDGTHLNDIAAIIAKTGINTSVLI